MACAREKVRLGHSRSGGEGAPNVIIVWHKGEELQQVAAVGGQSSMALPAQKIWHKAQGIRRR